MAQQNIKQIKGTTQGSILFLGTYGVVSENFNSLNWNESNNSLNIQGDLNLSGTASIGQSLVITNGLDLKQIDFSTQSVNSQERRLYWNDNIKTLSIGTIQNTDINIGQEELYFVLNQTGATLSAGKVVKFNGASSSTDTLSVNYFLSDGSFASNYVLGVVKSEIPNNQEGFVTKFGLLPDINTTGSEYGETWSSGDILYASSTNNGGLTNVKPLGPNLSIITGIVISATTSGSIFVNQSYYGKLSDLDDVKFYGITPSQGNILRYSTTASAWLINEYDEGAYNAGIISGATSWSDPVNGQIVLPTVRVALYDNPYYLGPLRLYDVTGATSGTNGIPILTNNDTNYIFIDYNSGNPIWNISTSDAAINGSSVVRFITVYRNDTFIHTLEFGNIGAGLSEKLNERQIAVQRCARESGLTIGLSGSTGILTITDGVLWNGPFRQVLSTVNSVDDYMFKNWRVSNNWTYSISDPFTYSAVTDLINNTYYDNGNLITASAGYYLVNYYYRGQEINDHIYEIYSQDQYETFAEAELVGVPIIPELVSSHAILVGRVIVQVGTYSGVAQSSFVEVFESTTVTSHNDLIGLQGGLSGEYFHLSSNQYSNNAYINVDNQFSVNQTINGYQLKTETWTESNILIATTNSIIGSGFTFNDSATTSNNLWSAQKIFNYTNRESIAGLGLSSNSGVLSVNLGQNSGLTFSGDDIVIDSNIAGIGLTFTSGILNVNLGDNSGLSFSGDNIIIESSIAGIGLTFNNGTLDINLSSNSGLTFSGDNIIIDSTIAGTGLTFTNGIINTLLGATSGLTFSGDSIIIDPTIAGNGLDFNSGILTVNTSEITSTLAGAGLTSNGSAIDVNVSNGIQIVSDILQLGGTLSQPVTITANNNDFIISSASTILFNSAVFDVAANGLISIDAGTGSIQIFADDTVILSASNSVGIITNGDITLSFLQSTLIDSGSGYGLVYSSDYSNTFVTNSLVNKAYVDNQTVFPGSGLTSSSNIFSVEVNSESIEIDGNNQLRLKNTITGNRTFTDSIVIQGDLTVEGTQSIINTENVYVRDNIITLNATYSGLYNFLDAGIEVNLGGGTFANLIWDSSESLWSLGFSGSTSTIITENGFGLTKSGNTLSIDTNDYAVYLSGDGLTSNGGTISVGAGTGITVSSDLVSIDFVAITGQGLTQNGTQISLSSDSAGTGLSYSSGVLNVNLGINSGLTFSGDDIIIDPSIAGIGLTFTNGVLDIEVEPDIFTSSSLTYSVVLNTGQYNYLIGIDTSINSVVFQLPSASFGRAILYIKDIGANSFTNNITILPDGTDTILTTVIGATSVTLEADGSAIICSSDGINTWWLM